MLPKMESRNSRARRSQENAAHERKQKVLQNEAKPPSYTQASGFKAEVTDGDGYSSQINSKEPLHCEVAEWVDHQQ